MYEEIFGKVEMEQRQGSTKHQGWLHQSGPPSLSEHDGCRVLSQASQWAPKSPGNEICVPAAFTLISPVTLSKPTQRQSELP
jgi:hypothetical protein